MFNILFVRFLCIIHKSLISFANLIAILYDISNIFSRFQFFNSTNQQENSLLIIFYLFIFFLDEFWNFIYTEYKAMHAFYNWENHL